NHQIPRPSRHDRKGRAASGLVRLERGGVLHPIRARLHFRSIPPLSRCIYPGECIYGRYIYLHPSGEVMEPSRRGFLLGTSAAAALGQSVVAQTSSASATGMPTRPLGRTGQRVSVLGLGGCHIGAIKDEAQAIRLMHTAI